MRGSGMHQSASAGSSARVLLSPPQSRSCCSRGKWLFCITCDILGSAVGGEVLLGLCRRSDPFHFFLLLLVIYVAGKQTRQSDHS